MEDPAMNGLQTVACVWQRSGVDDRVGVLQEGIRHLGSDIDIDDASCILARLGTLDLLLTDLFGRLLRHGVDSALLRQESWGFAWACADDLHTSPRHLISALERGKKITFLDPLRDESGSKTISSPGGIYRILPRLSVADDLT